jgi:hypothetical protein
VGADRNEGDIAVFHNDCFRGQNQIERMPNPAGRTGRLK